jgi:hypothetical protein
MRRVVAMKKISGRLRIDFIFYDKYGQIWDSCFNYMYWSNFGLMQIRSKSFKPEKDIVQIEYFPVE